MSEDNDRSHQWIPHHRFGLSKFWLICFGIDLNCWFRATSGHVCLKTSSQDNSSTAQRCPAQCQWTDGSVPDQWFANRNGENPLSCSYDVLIRFVIALCYQQSLPARKLCRTFPFRFVGFLPLHFGDGSQYGSRSMFRYLWRNGTLVAWLNWWDASLCLIIGTGDSDQSRLFIEGTHIPHG